MVQSVTYQSETKTVHFQGKSIVLESLTPVLSPKEKEKRKKEIEYKQSLGTFVVPKCTKVKELIKEYVRIYGHGNGSVWSYY